MKKFFAVIMAGLVILAVGCKGETEPGTRQSATSGTMNAKIGCDTGSSSGQWFYEISYDLSTWTRPNAKHSFTCTGATSFYGNSETLTLSDAEDDPFYRLKAEFTGGGTAVADGDGGYSDSDHDHNFDQIPVWIP